jgi:hypothetical protein
MIKFDIHPNMVNNFIPSTIKTAISKLIPVPIFR